MLSGCDNSQEPHASDYRQYVRPRDPEERLRALAGAYYDKPIDISAFAGMSKYHAQAASNYVQAVCRVIKAEPIKQRRYYYRDQRHTEPVYDREVIVPWVLLPRPGVVEAWAASNKARSLDWRTEESVTENRGAVYGRTVIFEPGPSSQVYVMTGPVSFEEEVVDWDLGFTDSHHMLGLKKLVAAPAYKHGQLRDQAADLRLGEKDGAELLGEFVTVPAFLKNHRLRWTTIRKGSETRRFLAYALLDGHSRSSRRLVCERHQPRIKQHDELLLPTPLGWPPMEKDTWKLTEFTSGEETEFDNIPHEEWCLDDWFPAQPDACWVIREAEDSKPLQESFLLMPASEPSDRPVFFIALFAETKPEQLVKELAAVSNVSPDAVLQSPDAMQSLNVFYERLRSFSLSNWSSE